VLYRLVVTEKQNINFNCNYKEISSRTETAMLYVIEYLAKSPSVIQNDNLK